jgi:hypothetical protein
MPQIDEIPLGQIPNSKVELRADETGKITVTETLEIDADILCIDRILCRRVPPDKHAVRIPEENLPLVLGEVSAPPRGTSGIGRDPMESRFLVIDLDSLESFQASKVMITQA